MLKKAVSEAAADESTGGVPSGYVEDLNDARTKLAGCFSRLLVEGERNRRKRKDKHGKCDPSDNDPLPAQRYVNIVHRRMSEAP